MYMLCCFPNDTSVTPYINVNAAVIFTSPDMIYSKEFQENRVKVAKMLHGVVVNVMYELHDTLKKDDDTDEKTE